MNNKELQLVHTDASDTRKVPQGRHFIHRILQLTVGQKPTPIESYRLRSKKSNKIEKNQ
jgi:hypothetical protein